MKIQANNIYSKDVASIIFSSSLALSPGIIYHIMFETTKNDTIFSVILGSIISLIIFAIYYYIFKYNERENIIENLNNDFSKITRIILKLSLGVGILIIASCVLFNIADFIHIEYLSETSINYFELLMFLPLIYICSKSLPVIIRTNQIFSIISIFFIIFNLTGIFTKLDITNLQPILISSKANILKSSLLYCSISIIVFTMLNLASKKVISDKENIGKSIKYTYIFTHIIQVIIILATILILGREYLSMFAFPEYIVLKQFTLFNMFERTENFLALQLFFNSFTLLSFMYYMLKELLPKTRFRKYYSVIISAIIYLISNIVFKEGILFNYLMNKYITYVIYGLINIPILCIFFKIAKITKKRKKFA